MSPDASSEANGSSSASTGYRADQRIRRAVEAVLFNRASGRLESLFEAC